MGQDVESRYASNGDVKIHYGVQGSGPLVVMVHGFPDYWGTWKRLMAALSSAGYRAAALDGRGYNLSDKPEGLDKYEMRHLIGDVEAVIKAEGRSSAIVVGHDWGAVIAWEVAIQRPDLVDKLIVLSVPHPITFGRELDNNPAQMESSVYVARLQAPGSEAAFTPESLTNRFAEPDLRAEYFEVYSRSNLTSMLNYYRANWNLRGKAASAEMQNPPKVQAPTLVIGGAKDPAVQPAGHDGQWAHIAANSTLVMLPDVAHWIQREVPDLLERTVKNWLASQDA